ncbi:ABC transporter substrate-binding protein [Cochlodiniinecator piscidefendens]|uniref:ABC transporter substrate-binding protein n=1 Tax=Cochlodiniinecator piscidefendens TaxID=2715756 RepID=UPI001407A160|nr:ABC transporter substrate-binding protein [Cochlodiniinecator piscidefendens]
MTLKLLNGSIGRRGFLAGSAAAVGLAHMPLPLRAQAQKGGTFRLSVNQGGTTDTLNPAEANGSQQIMVGWALRNNLTEIGSDNALHPELATSWSSDDAATWIFQLRQGVTFHNGKSLSPEDVIASLNLHRGEDSTSGAKSLLAGVTDISAEGDSAVRITLDAPNADFPFILSDYHFQIMPVGADGLLDMSGVGTGGYTLADWNPGIKTVLQRNPDYWKENAAHFDTVEVLLISDSAAATTALVTGEIDAVQSAEYRTLSQLGRDENIAIESISGGFHPTFAMQSGVEPFNNRDVRLALKYGVDREALVDRVLRGHGTVANDHPIAPTMPYFDPSIEQRAYDPDRAKYHLTQAGLDNLSVSLSVSDSLFAGAVDAVTLYREHAAPAGIDVQVAREPGDGYWSDVWMKKPFFTGSWGARPVPDMIFATAYAQNADWNESQFNHDQFQQLMIAARSELDEAKRGQMYSDMQVILRDEGGSVIPFFRNFVYARRTGVAHSENVASNWSLDGYKAIERWWAV